LIGVCAHGSQQPDLAVAFLDDRREQQRKQDKKGDELQRGECRHADEKRAQGLTRGGEHAVALDDLHVGKARQPELYVIQLGRGRQLQQERRHTVEFEVSGADVGMPHAAQGRHFVGVRRRGRFGSRLRPPTEGDDIGERGEADKVGIVEGTHPGLGEPAGDAHRHAADAQGIAECIG
jgi:hypothetical protein